MELLKGLSNKWLGTKYPTSSAATQGFMGDGSYAFVNPNTGTQEFTGDLSNNPEAQHYLSTHDINGNTISTDASVGLGAAGGILKGLQAYAGLQQSALAKKQLGLAKEQFGFEKAATNRNLYNQATQYNTGLQNSGEVGLALAGNTMDDAARSQRLAQIEAQKLSTNSIG